MLNKLNFFAASIAAFLLWSNVVSAQESTLDVVKKRGTLIAGVKNDYPPAGYLNSNGDWVGLDVDMAKYIAKKLGVKLQMEAVSHAPAYQCW